MSDERKKPEGTKKARRWILAGELDGSEHLACIDGRYTSDDVAVPGGDAGELIILLDTVEHLSGRTLTDEEIDEAVVDYLERFQDFHMHTDTRAVAHLWEALANEGCDVERVAPATLLHAPPEAVRAAILLHMAEAEFTGCGHLAGMLIDPDRYEVRLQLVAAVVRSALTRHWAGDPRIEVEMLIGVHEEQHIVAIDDNIEIDASTPLPMVGRGERHEAFVYHRAVARYLQRARGPWAVAWAASKGMDLELEDVVIEATRLAAAQLGVTIERLAPDLPIDEVGLHNEDA